MNRFSTTIVFVLILFFSSLILQAVPDKGAAEANVQLINKANISFRIGVPLWASEKRCTEVFNLFDKYKGVTDEITFFTSATHPPLPIKVFKERASILKIRIAEAKKRGYKAIGRAHV